MLEGADQMRKPRILISLAKDIEDEQPETYIEAVEKAGGIPIAAYYPETEGEYDGLLLTGGGDVDPSFFGEENKGSHFIDMKRDRSEFALIPWFLEHGKPILGICRGHQVLNIALGGKLIQNLELDISLFHCPGTSGQEGDLWHPIGIKQGSYLAKSYGLLTTVNSTHHQALSKPGEGMQVVAVSESGLIEGTEHVNLPLLSVQFHPERMEDGGAIFDWLIKACLNH